MSARVDPQLLFELKKYGTVSVEKCFNCGNCTATCPLSTNGETFPRRIIRYAQLGLKKPLLSSKELWLCYYCGECTQTCPKQADPGEFMATARRYAIASYDPLGLAKLLYTSPILSTILLTLLAMLIGLVVYTSHGPMNTETLKLFDFIPSVAVHNLGIGALVIVALTGLVNTVNMIVQTRRENVLLTTPNLRLNWLGALGETVIEVLTQRRYQRDCETGSAKPAWYLQKWFIHASMLWGFLGLLAATALDFGLELLGIKPTGTWVPLWNPVRLLGTLAGLLLVYGVTVAIVNRFRKADEASTYSTASDWVLLILLWLTGVSGFILEIALYLPSPAPWAYWTLLGHISVAVELLLLLPYTKFAHAIYRTIALYFRALKPVPATEPAKAGTG
jgi:ferredoxin